MIAFLGRPYATMIWVAPVMLGLVWLMPGDAAAVSDGHVGGDQVQRMVAMLALVVTSVPAVQDARAEADKSLHDPAFWIFGAYVVLQWAAMFLVLRWGNFVGPGNLFAICLLGGFGVAALMMALFDTPTGQWHLRYLTVAKRQDHRLWLRLVFVGIGGLAWTALLAIDLSLGPVSSIPWMLICILPFLERRYRWPRGSLEFVLNATAAAIGVACIIALYFLQ